MKVLCKFNNINQTTSETALRLKKYVSMPDGELDLETGKEYVVYGIEFRDNYPWLYICSEDSDEYPRLFSAELFEIIDPTLSSYWSLSLPDTDNRQKSKLVFNEWATNPIFYEYLVDGNEWAASTFSKYKALINEEQQKAPSKH
ncbi:hypothetical protein [Pseudomonas sp. NPDC089534]|uniref:hypothetical protein n=1 Tax=Pseudomonas sp. NPDC089534 TaxID=3364468 RepID=UPI00381528EC